MLKKLKVSGFKSLHQVEIDLPKLTVLFGPNAAGKSNILDAVSVLSRVAASRTLLDVFAEPVRGWPIEAFSFPAGGMAELLNRGSGQFAIEADLVTGGPRNANYRYRLGVGFDTRSGRLSVTDEYLTELNAKGEPKGKPRIEVVGDEVLVRRKKEAGKPRHEQLGLPYALLSDRQLSDERYPEMNAVREELWGWRTYYLDPRTAMRTAQPPAAVDDIGMLGHFLGPFLYRLNAEDPKRFAAVTRTLKSLSPNVEDLTVSLNETQGTIDILLRQGGIQFSSRVISEGTLRLLALCAIALNPWNHSLLTFEEPENGVHPRRLELIADLLAHLALVERRQLIVTTHSPLFCESILRKTKRASDAIGLRVVQHKEGRSVVTPLNATGPLFEDTEVRRALTSEREDGLFESLILRGLIDAS